MVQTEAFVWLHLPRTGGTSTVAAMRQAKRALPRRERATWLVDDDKLRLKHDNLATRAVREGRMVEAERVAMNMRPLGDWLMSNHKWATHMGLHVPVERYREGEFFSFRLGRWCPADWWLGYFDVDKVTDFLRLDHLAEDLQAFLAEVHPQAATLQLPHLNDLGASRPAAPDVSARERNPLWSTLEARLWPEGTVGEGTAVA